jgi:hypothetical protein
MTWALTPWGLICKEISDFVVDATEGYPQFSIGIGPDADDLNDAGPRITFVPLDGSFEQPRYGGGLEEHGTFDETIPVRVRIQTRYDLDTSTNEDRSPLLLHAVVSRFLEGCDAVRHTPYLVPNGHGRRGGRIGEMGACSVMTIGIRIEYMRTPATMGTATAVTMGLGVSGPDGDGGSVVDEFEVIGDASP